MTLRMSPSEAIMWAAEKDPALRSDFSNLTILDGLPDVDRLRDKIEQALVSLPRLAERVVNPPLRIAPPEWRPDPTIDLAYHLRRVALPDRARCATCSTSPPRSLRRRSTGPARSGSSPSSRVWPTGAPRCCNDCTTRSPTGWAASSSRSASSTSSACPRRPSTTPCAALAEEEQGREMHAALEDPVDRASPLGVLRDAVDYALTYNVGLVRSGVAAGADLALHPTTAPATRPGRARARRVAAPPGAGRPAGPGRR